MVSLVEKEYDKKEYTRSNWCSDPIGIDSVMDDTRTRIISGRNNSNEKI